VLFAILEHDGRGFQYTNLINLYANGISRTVSMEGWDYPAPISIRPDSAETGMDTRIAWNIFH
jgi:hypothetical protein